MLIIKIIAVFIMSAGIGALYRIPRNSFIYGSINGTMTWVVSGQLIAHGASAVVGNFFGGIAAGLLAELLARLLKKPATIFIIPGFIPLVPGREAYATMRYLVEGQYSQAVSMGTQTMLVAGAIAFGIFLSSTVYRLIQNYIFASVNGYVEKN